MLTKCPAKRVTIFVSEGAQRDTVPLWRLVFDLLLRKQASGVTITRPIIGFGSHHGVQPPSIEASAEPRPLRIEFVDSSHRVEELLPDLYDLAGDGLIEAQDTTLLRVARTDAAMAVMPHIRKTGAACLMRIFLGEADQWHGEPLYDAMMKNLRVEGIAGATVYKGILGYGAKGHTHKQSFFHSAHDSPMMISVIDSEVKIMRATEIVEPMLQDGLVVISDATIVRLVHASPATEVEDAGNADR